ncbi:WxL protein peptidoglycan domain-containing protein [Saccharopolyspora sp. 5N708]|uniref:WxL protein peptidoglycan domain-containing protein n=1 Tax=Saccharopolyspora sp. 5N708 TaxID=3457424 RepID=UPI003FD27310
MHPFRPRPTTSAGTLVHAAAVVLLAAISLVGLGAGPASAADGDVPWTVRTGSNDFGADRQNYSYTLNPGGQLADGLVVVNHGTTPLDLAVYAADAFTTDAGQLDLVPKDATSTGVGAWVHPGRDHLTIQPGETVEVPFTVALPDNATPGDHMGGIVTSLTQAGAGDRGNVEQRRGIRIRLRVGGELNPGLSVEDLRVHYPGTPNPVGDGDATVTYTIRNTGNAIVKARQAASVSGPFGLWGVSSEQVDDSPELLPGDTWKVSAPVHGVAPTLLLTGTVSLVPLLTDASGSTAPLAAVETTAHAWAITWVLLLVVALCGLVVVIVVSRRRRRKAKLRKNNRAEDTGAPEVRARETSDQ